MANTYRMTGAQADAHARIVNEFLDGFVPPGVSAIAVLVAALAHHIVEASETSANAAPYMTGVAAALNIACNRLVAARLRKDIGSVES